MAKTSTPTPSLGAAMADLLRSLSDGFFDTYRPELHYMRGPGPKWREKHGIAASRAGLAVTPLRRPLLERFTTNERNFGSPNADFAWSFRSASLQTKW